MANEINTGGPAYPVVAQFDVFATGMTLRDWFAGQVVSADLASMEPTALPSGVTVEQYWAERANFAYMVSDAMLKAREAKP